METKEKTLRKQLKKSQLKASNLFEYEYLMKSAPGLLPCEIKEDGEDIVFLFDMEGMRPLSELKQEELEYRYRFLQNFYRLKQTWKNYALPMDEENIYFDFNFMPYIALRDVKEELNDRDEEYNFRNAYQELTAGLIGRKYTYKQVKESGLMIVIKDKAVDFVLGCKNAEELYEQICKRAEKLYLVNKNEKIRLDRKSYKVKISALVISVIALVLMLAYTGYQTFVVLPRDKTVIQASRAYTVQNYVECIDKLKTMEPEQMDTYTKYILAVSYARSEALEKAELANILEKLSIYSNEIELEYWIAIGRSNFALAENYAKALSDDKLLIYAYMKELNYLEGSVAVDGEEKQNRMNELSNAITEIGKKYTEE